jgi:hypothetical protein
LGVGDYGGGVSVGLEEGVVGGRVGTHC